ncbi:MAG: hypothetical protein KO217_01580 [Methanobacteriaceae archaeon]|jgi:predicted transcriptional regulator|nr:MAG: hypothetical protein CIT01_01680 [Methanobacterium sp. BRmetb2]MCC7557361.1 hypothetical protein [Methanobacteriaceae archaeon]
MITITKKENIVLDQIKYFQAEFGGGISPNILKMDLNMSEHEVKEIISLLIDKKLVVRVNNDHVMFKDNDHKVQVVDSRADVKKEELNQLEMKAFDIIKSITDDSSMVSRHVLEGHLLYGDLNLSTFRMYHIIISLEIKGLIKKVRKSDGEYYQVNP